MRAREPSTTKSRIGIMTTKNFYVLAAPLPSNQELGQEPQRIVIKQPSFTPPRIEAEPERRLWKICAQAVPLRLGAVEWIAFPFRGLDDMHPGLLRFRVASAIQQRLARPGRPCAPKQIRGFNNWCARRATQPPQQTQG
jgi:hypothetical protein